MPMHISYPTKTRTQIALSFLEMLNLTDARLGLKKTANLELNTGKRCDGADPDYKKICSWFEDIWKNAKEEILIDPEKPKAGKISVKNYFIQKIDDYFRKYTPEEIYYKILYEMFHDEVGLDNSIEHHRDMSRLGTSVIWNTLFNYQ